MYAEADRDYVGVDDVMNVSGHRISTVEAENAFVTLREGVTGSSELVEDLRAFVGAKLGKFVTPKQVMFTPELPKNRGAKIMRRLLRDIAEGRPAGDTTS